MRKEKQKRFNARMVGKIIDKLAAADGCVSEAFPEENELFVLLEMMKTFSERNWCAGWMCDFEYKLWDLLNSTEQPGHFKENEWAKFQELVLTVGGWWVWSDQFKCPVFMKLADWRKIVKQRKLEDKTIKKISSLPKGWSKNIRADGRVEAVCPHGVGHTISAPEKYKKFMGKYWDIHGCDGCCNKLKV